MRHVVQALLVASRGAAICAVVAGLAAGLLQAIIGATVICIDSCPPREFYFSYIGPGAVRLMTPCVVLAVLAMAIFLLYCLATQQARRAAMPILFLLVGGLVGVAALGAILQLAQATLPVEADGVLFKGSSAGMGVSVGTALTLVAGVWSGVLARLQWRR